MYCKSIFDKKVERIQTKTKSEFAILHALNLITEGLLMERNQLLSKCRHQELVTARIIFSSLAFEFGARNIDIALFLQRKQPTITYFLQQNRDRSKFDKNYKNLKDKINSKQNVKMGNSLIADIAAAASKIAVNDLLTVLKEQGIIKDGPDKGIQDYLDSQKGGKNDLGGKQLDIFDLKGNRASTLSPEEQLKLLK